jgi:hypothetical protein
MSMAWETTVDDIVTVCANNGETVTEEQAENIIENLDYYKIEKEALHGDDMLEQLDYAYDEIWEQIVEKNLV